MATSLPPSGAAGAGSVPGGGGSAGSADVATSSSFPPFPPELVQVEGTARDDVLIGDADNEEMTAFRGDDVLFGGAGDDRLDGGIGDDRLEGGPGWDSYDGGPGRDTLSFHTGQTSAFVDLSTGSVMLADTFEFVLEVENLTGSDFGDTLLGDDEDNVLAGGGGLDLLGGGLGDDRLDGGADGAYATWAGQDGAVLVDLAAGRATEWDGGVDALVDILGAVGTDHDDTLLGNGQGNRLEGGLGDDRLDGRAGDDVLVGGDGIDILIGGAGTDLVDYSGGDAVRVNLLAGEAFDESGGATDTLTGIEDVLGSLGRDTLVGDDRANRLEGSVGRDILRGNGGDDTFVFADRLDFGDTIEDFGAGDTIEVARAAVGPDGRVVFDAGGDRLLLDPGGDAALVVIATVLGGNPSAADVVLV
ncbi:MAG TPA: hypothetical protein VLL76_08040 [Candidatus Omnitrophota bacterium]|nr:hypothetical protein [Candidatus Omnitrophota bacterium]